MFGPYLRNLMTLLLIGLAPVFPIYAQEMSIDDLLTEIDKRIVDKVAKQNAIQAGRDRTILCKSCHGADGNSKKSDVPNLAGQNAGYLLDQISRFADGRRKDFVMNQLAKNFSTEDKINIAIFYYSMPVKRHHVNKHLAKKGKNLYKNLCSNCHGEGGLGDTNLARLAGQRAEYVKNALINFQNAARRSSTDSNFRRRNPIMETVVENLTNKQIEQVAEFVAQLPDDPNQE
jgi:cytochrome c553